MFKEREIRFRTYNVLDNNPFDFAKLKGKVTACVQYTGPTTSSIPCFRVGLSYCSPKERQPNKKLGQYIALKRMASNTTRGVSFIYLMQYDKDAPSLKGLTNTIKELIVAEAERKNIRWMKGIKPNQIV